MSKLSDFTRISKLGKGSYGVVYKAKIDDETYAVKRNLTDDTIDFAGCIRELDILLRLDHPNIVRLENIIYDQDFPVGDHTEQDVKDDCIHFGFEMCKYDLHRMIYYTSMSKSEKKKIMVDILLGLEYIHSRGIIHRDMKPANVLISINDKGEPVAKICDFNLSKPFCSQGINSPKIITSCYRPPEVVDNKVYDLKVDIWSTGCIFYEMVLKKRIVNGHKDGEISKEIQKMLKLDSNGNAPYMSELAKEWKESIPFFDKIFTGPTSRWNATQLLNHEFLNDHRAYIDQMRRDHPVCPCTNTIYQISNRKDRDEGIKVFIKLLLNHSKSSWYRHRTFFMAIDIFERYMMYLQEHNLPALNSDDLQFLVYICVYIAIKYYSIMNMCDSFSYIAGKKYNTQEFLKKGMELERLILDQVLDFKIYRKTIYEAADELGARLTIGVVQSLFEMILCHPTKINGKSVLEVAKMVLDVPPK
jgi:serine/threonine protein kinase